jgi:hypothetical protein
MPQRQSYCPKRLLLPFLQTAISSTKTNTYKSKGKKAYPSSLATQPSLEMAQNSQGDEMNYVKNL